MSPARDKSVEAERLSFTAQTVVAVIVVSFLFGTAQYVFSKPDRDAQTQMQSDIRNIGTRMDSSAEVRKLEKELLDQRFNALEAKIDAAGLRNAALNLSQELQKAKGK